MRYNLESTLPIRAFRPLGGRHSPFKHGMTLEGGAIEAVGDVVGGAIETVGEGIVEAGRGVNNFVKDEIPGGWATVAAIAVPYAAPYFTGAALTAGQAAALAAGTSAATGAIQGKDPKDILKDAALAGATSYGLGSLGGESIDLPSETPYIDMPDGAELLTPESLYVPDEAAGPYIDGTTPPPRDFDYVPESSGSPELTSKKVDISQSADDYSNVLNKDGVTAAFADPNDVFYKDFLNNPQNPISQEVLASTVQPSVGLSPEEKFELMMQNAQEMPMSSNFRPAGEPSFTEDPFKYASNKVVDTYDYLRNAPENAYRYLRDTPIKEMGSDLYDFAGDNYGKIGLGALMLSGAGGQPQPQPQQYPAGYTPSGPYTGGYGVSGGVASPYALRNRVTAQDIYNYQNPYDRYATVNRRYAKGGEVKHFAFGGITNALRGVLPYAGIFAAPFISNPVAAVGVGAFLTLSIMEYNCFAPALEEPFPR